MARRRTMTDEEIVLRARAVFVERGYAARTKDVAAAVGLTWGAITLRFGSKRELFRRAMTDPDGECSAAGCTGSATDLGAVLRAVRAELREQWPRRLQYRLAEQAERPDDGWSLTVDRLVPALQAHAALGAVRSDIPGPELAHLVVDLLVGDVARRFVRREPTLREDALVIQHVMRLVGAREIGGAS